MRIGINISAGGALTSAHMSAITSYTNSTLSPAVTARTGIGFGSIRLNLSSAPQNSITIRGVVPGTPPTPSTTTRRLTP
jgi:hypothetical protein